MDVHTDMLIQQSIKECFKESTVLTIAHRLNTIIDYDRVVVLHFGQVAEFGRPKDLLANKNGLFTKMVEETGANNSVLLKTKANKRRNSILMNVEVNIEKQDSTHNLQDVNTLNSYMLVE